MQCAASIICVDGQNRILLGRRSDNHKWGYSGGSVEIDEYVEDCAKRELVNRGFVETFGMGKDLSEMTLEELWELFPITLVAHDD